jgi:D-alanyl-lipoteichoic acid acyltransferase DltB (MBOAT superfamily)
MQNFDRPYHARSIGEFWRRWHISLSSWFKDYLYIPLGGSRVTIPRWYLNLFIVFLVSGLWHGANWTFIIWGALHGFYMVFSLVTKGARERLRGLLRLPELPWFQRFAAFTLVSFAWVFFRAKDASTALYMIKRAITDVPLACGLLLRHQSVQSLLPSQTKGIAVCILLILLLETVHAAQNHVCLRAYVKARPPLVRWAIYYAGLAALFLLGVFQDRQFIYFQF